MRTKTILLTYILLTLNGFASTSEETPSPLPPHGPYVKEGYNFYSSIEFLYSKAIQNGLCYAETGVAIIPGTTSTSSGSVHRVHFPWVPGFKVGIGYYPPHDGWDLFANYTWLHSSSSDSTKSENGNIIPYGMSSKLINSITSAKADWNLHFNSVDLELGRNLYVSRFITFRPFGGLKFTWQDQHLLTRYQVNDSINALNGIASSHQDQDVWGLGIRLGGNSNWYFYRSWSIATKVAFSGLWLDYNNTRKDRFEYYDSPGFVINNLKKGTDTIKAVLELFLGLHGEWWFKEERYHLALQGGFDEQLWINFGEFIYLFSQGGHGDFSMCGFTMKARLDF